MTFNDYECTYLADGERVVTITVRAASLDHARRCAYQMGRWNERAAAGRRVPVTVLSERKL